MWFREILKLSQVKLKAVSPTAFLDAEILVGFVLGLSRTDLILKSDFPLNSKQEKEILELIERRLKNEPIAYLTHSKEFYGLDFYVNESVLIPRPETEILIEAVRSLVLSVQGEDAEMKNEKLKMKNDYKDISQETDKIAKLVQVPANGTCGDLNQHLEELRMKVIDVGTGSGCIPIALAQNLQNVDFVAIDVSEKALEIARKNVKRFGLEKRIELVKGDLLEIKNEKLKMKNDHKEIIITANLPYVEDEAELSAEVKDYEPHLALFAGEDGLDLYRKLLVQVAEIKPRAVFLEIDPRQVLTLIQISQKLLPAYAVEVVKDLAGKERVFVLQSVSF